jgi:hypothetical protein
MADAFMKHFPSAEVTRFMADVALAQSQKKTIEVEARFQMLNGSLLSKAGTFPTAPIPASVFYRMQDYLTVRQLPSTTEETTDSTQGDVRRTEARGRVSWMRKRRIGIVQSASLGVRLAVSEETPLPPPASFRPEYTRTKKRTSYVVLPGVARLDMTRVTDSNRRVSYEVELECMNLALVKSKFVECASIVWKWLAGSNTLYTLEDLRAVVAQDLTLASPSVQPGEDPLMRFNRDVLVQARNLKREDIVYGGLVGNPETEYEVTAKADGIRKLMVFTPSGCWLVMPPYEYNRVLTYEPMMQPLVGSWLDGELVPVERRNREASPPDTPYWFLVFDVLRVEGRSVQAAPLRTRLTLAKTVADLFLTHRTLRVHAKEFYPVHRVQDLFTTMTSLRQREPTLAYKIDGYMFTPSATPYNPRSHELAMEQRLLVAVPDIVKWKPPEELTIDFAVRKESWGLGLYSSKKGVRGGVLFRGTEAVPFQGEIVPSRLLDGIETDTVVEFGWNEQERALEARRVRFDKVVGNDIRIAEEVWNDIHNPLPFTALSSENNDTTRLRFALEWEIRKMPVDVVVRPSGLGGLLGALRLTGKQVVDVWDGSTPAVFLQSYPTEPLPETYYAVQDTRLLKEPPPGVLVDTWTVVQPLLGLFEQKEVKHYRMSWCMRTRTGAMYWPSPVFQARTEERGLDRLAILPPYRTIAETDLDGVRYVAFLPSTWKVQGRLEAPPPESPVMPVVIPRASEPVPEEDTQATGDAEIPPVPEEPEERAVWDLPAPPDVVRDFRNAIPVGALEDLQCSWYNEYPVMRLGTIGDGSCLLHALLQGYNPNYQTTPNKRTPYARRLRTALAEFITLQDPESAGTSFYESAGGGAVAAVVSLTQIQTLLRGNDYLGDETYALLGLCLGVNIYVVRATGTELHKYTSYIHPLRRQWTVVINGTTDHYETVGLRTPEGIQTAFVPEDPFLRALDAGAPGL